MIFCGQTTAQVSHYFTHPVGNGGGGRDIAQFVASDPSGSFLVAGSFEGTIDVDATAGQTTLTSMGGTDTYFAKYDGNGTLVWARSIGSGLDDEINGMEADAHGNLFIAGSFHETMDCDGSAGVSNLISSGGTDIFFCSYDGNGTLLFANGFGGHDDDEVRDLTIDAFSNAFLTGNFKGSVDFDPGAGTAILNAPQGGILLAKYTAGGNYEWAYTFGSGTTETGEAIAVDANRNIYLTGYFRNNLTISNNPNINSVAFGNPLFETIFLARFNESGQILNGKAVPNNTGATIAIGQMSVNDSSTTFLSGSYTGNVDFGMGSATLATASTLGEGFLVTYDSLFNYKWSLELNTDFYSVVSDFIFNNDGTTTLTGNFTGTTDFDPGAPTNNQSPLGTADLFVLQIDTAGSYLTAFYGGGANASVVPSGICSDTSGAPVIAGSLSGTAFYQTSSGTQAVTSVVKESGFLHRFNTSGIADLLLVNEESDAGGDDEAEKVIALADGGTLITGNFEGTVDFDPGASQYLLSSNGSSDAFLLFLNADGSLRNAFALGGSGDEKINAITKDGSGSVYISGTFTQSIDFDPGPAVFSLTSSGGYDWFMAKYSSSGNLIWAKKGGGSGNDAANDIDTDNSQTLFLSGYFSNTIDMNPGAPVNNLISAGNTDMFYARYDTSGNYISAMRIGGSNADAALFVKYEPLTGTIALCGNFSGTVNFNPSGSVSNMTSSAGVSGADLFFSKYSLSGSLIWVKQLGSSGAAISALDIELDHLNPPNLFIAGFIESRSSMNSTIDLDPGIGSVNVGVNASEGKQAFVSRYVFGNVASSGNYSWSGTYDSDGDDIISGLAVDTISNLLFLTGNFHESIDINFSNSQNYSLTSSGGSDFYLACYNLSGPDFVYAVSTGGIANDYSNGIDCGLNSSQFLCGQFTGTVDFAPGNYSAVFASASGSEDAFITRFGKPCQPLIYSDILNEINICPGQTYTILPSAGNVVSYYDAATGGNYLGSGTSFTSPPLNVTTTYYFEDSLCYLDGRIAVPVNVRALPNLAIQSSGPLTFCAGGSVSLNGGAGSDLSYQWKKYGNLIAGASDSVYVASTSGIYKITATNNYGCSKSSPAVTVVVNPLPVASVSATGNTSFCVGSGVTLQANVVPGYTYQWKKYSNDVVSAVNSTYFATTAGAFKVRITDANGCSRNSNSIFTTLLPSPPAAISAGGPLSFCNGDSVVLSANAGSGLSYQWRKGSSFIAGATTPVYTAKTAGNYKVTVTGTNGCTKNSDPLTVVVNCRLDDSGAKDPGIILYPNPTTSSSQLSAVNLPAAASELMIFDAKGDKVYSVSVFSASFDLPLPEFDAGMYQVVLISGSEIFKLKYLITP
jgi:hypothetical protein